MHLGFDQAHSVYELHVASQARSLRPLASVKRSACVVALGKAIRSALRERGHNQESFAARAEFSVTVDIVAKIAGGLNLSVSDPFAKARL